MRTAILVLLVLASCRSTPPPPPEPIPELLTAADTVEELYRTFCFDAGGPADWDGMRALFAPGAAFAAPIAPDAEPTLMDADEFVRRFQEWIADSEEGRSGLHERIVAMKVDRFGNIAQAWVVFEGFVPVEEEGAEPPAATRGIDSIQLVLSPDGWRVASFTSQFEDGEVALPADYLIRRP